MKRTGNVRRGSPCPEVGPSPIVPPSSTLLPCSCPRPNWGRAMIGTMDDSDLGELVARVREGRGRLCAAVAAARRRREELARLRAAVRAEMDLARAGLAFAQATLDRASKRNGEVWSARR